MSAQTSRRGPSILVRDPRESQPVRQRQPSRFITVDSVLQYASDIPSAQQRKPSRPRQLRTNSGRPVDPRLSGRFAPHLPPRSTKTSEKLVLLPEAVEEEDEKGEFAQTGDEVPPKEDDYRKPGKDASKSYAEKLPKYKRTEKDLPRATAFCTAQAYKLQSTAKFVRQRHGARAKLYDDCLYCAYHLPLIPGSDGYRVASSSADVGAKGRNILDEAIERSEQRDYRGTFSVGGVEEHSVGHYNLSEEQSDFVTPGERPMNDQRRGSNISNRSMSPTGQPDFLTSGERPINGQRRGSNISNRSVSPTGGHAPVDAYRFAEMYIFSYGVVVFWNFTERQEKDILADMTFSTIIDSNTNALLPLPLMSNPLDEEDFETEEFHFEYNNQISRPRVFNDMITLRNGDHMIKLAISHAIAQSTKLSFFEEKMAAQMEAAKDVPGRLAKTGELGMKREEVVKLLGGLFKSRVEVNLSSKVLDVPNLIWEDEPTLHPLYIAIREYLEIKPRIQVLNERCRVFLDLAEVLSDYISDNKMSKITWIIIFLIGVSILVTTSEVFLRFGMLNSRGSGAAKALAQTSFKAVNGQSELL